MAKKPSTVLSQLQTNPGLLAGGVAAGLVGGSLLLAAWRWWASLNAAAEVMRRYGLAPWHLLNQRTWRAARAVHSPRNLLLYGHNYYTLGL